MKVVKILLKAIVIIYAMAFSMGMGAELYRSSPEFRRGFEEGRDFGFNATGPVSKNSVKNGFKNTVVRGIGY